jgi:hypothetical protein
VRKQREDSFSKKKDEPRQQSSSSGGGKGSELNDEMQTRFDWKSDFQRRVAPYRPIDLLESERKRKRLSEINLPVLIPSPRQDPETAPVATAWAVPSAGERRRRKPRHSKQRRARE